MTAPTPGPQTDPLRTVERAMAGLDGLTDRPLGEHVEVFERIHAALGDALAAGSSGGT
jgi:hypothetical protein